MQHSEVVIVGSGFAGLCMGVRLKQAGIDDFVILEQGREIGGTWRDNRYPGCACDVPSHLYSFSFAQNPAWSRKYPRQDELLAYTRQVADTFGLVPHVRLGAGLLAARWDQAAGLWRLQTAAGERTATTLVLGLGALGRPAYPQLRGLADFTGKTFHSARWDHDYDLHGKRVAVIGTGASAIQFVPEIAGQVARLDLYQRTPPWIMPRRRPRDLAGDRQPVRRQQPRLLVEPQLEHPADRHRRHLQLEAHAVRQLEPPARRHRGLVVPALPAARVARLSRPLRHPPLPQQLAPRVAQRRHHPEAIHPRRRRHRQRPRQLQVHEQVHVLGPARQAKPRPARPPHLVHDHPVRGVQLALARRLARVPLEQRARGQHHARQRQQQRRQRQQPRPHRATSPRRAAPATAPRLTRGSPPTTAPRLTRGSPPATHPRRTRGSPPATHRGSPPAPALIVSSPRGSSCARAATAPAATRSAARSAAPARRATAPATPAPAAHAAAPAP